MIWDPAHECMPYGDMKALQLVRLKQLVEKVYNLAPHYKKTFDGAKIKPEDIKSVDDLRRLPFTVKEDLRDNYPYSLFAAPMDDIVRIHASSGTTGKQTVVGYTANDIENWTEMMARTFTSAGITSKDILQNSFGYGLFTGGLGAHYGGERIKASVIPVSGGNSVRQIKTLTDFGTTAICCTPSYAASLIETAADMGVNLRELKVRNGVFGAEAWTDAMRKEIEDKWGIRATDVYGLSEIMGPGVSYDCIEQNGLHVCEDHFIVEIIDPDTLEVLPEGEQGELVFTTITKEGIPLIRYRTKDISRFDRTPCSCGRTFVKMAKVSGRSDDMLIIRGVNVFPSQIEALLMENRAVLPFYQLIIDKQGALDTLEVQVEVAEDNFRFDTIRDLQRIEKDLELAIKDHIGITTDVRLVEPKTITRSEGKAQRVIDRRVKY